MAGSAGKARPQRQECEREAWQLATARDARGRIAGRTRTRIREAEELRAELTTRSGERGPGAATPGRTRLAPRQPGWRRFVSSGNCSRRKPHGSANARRNSTPRPAEFAEQAGMLKGRMTQALDLQSRLEADRVAVREREAALGAGRGSPAGASRTTPPPRGRPGGPRQGARRDGPATRRRPRRGRAGAVPRSRPSG